jgi:PAS domain S-box-containing protein
MNANQSEALQATQQALRESEERFARFMQHLPGLAWIKDLQGRYVYANDAAEKAFQTPRARLYGKTDLEVFPAAVAAQFRENDERALAQGAGVQVVETLAHEDGVLHHSIVSKFPIPGPDGRVAHVGGMAIDVTEHQQAEEALRGSEARYRAIVESQSEMVCRFRPDGEILFVNGAYARVRGVTPESLVGLSFWQFVPQRDRPHVMAMLAGLRPDAPEVCIENRFQTSQGIRWILWTNHALTFDAHGRASEVQSSGIDITDRKRAEAALEAKEAELQLVAETTPLILTRCNRELRYLFANRAAAALFGRTPEQMIDQPIAQVMGPQAFELIKPHIEQVLRGEPVEYEALIPYGTVGPRWMRVNYVPDRDAHGQVTGWVASIVDITDRKRVEQTAQFLADASAALAELKDDETTLQRIATLAVPFFSDWCAVDMLQADGSLRRLAVMHADPAKVKYAYELQRRYPPDPQAPHGIFKVLRTGKPEMVKQITDEQIVTAARDEEHRRVLRDLGLKSYICVPLISRGKALGALTFVTAESHRCYDWAELRAAEDLAQRVVIALENSSLYRALKEADRRKDEFLATLAHELRNPLAPIRNSLHILRLAGAEGAVAEPVREMLERQVNHMVRLVDDLLEVARITQGQIELRAQPIELAAVVRSAVETSRPLLEAARHQLAISLPTEPLVLQADPVRLAQVLSNLLNNAAKYTDDGGQIQLSVRREANDAVICVRDNGIGIPPAMLPKVFEPFTQINRTYGRAQGGLGIGLTLVRSLVEMHGGSVKAQSAGPGQGSEFIVRLPLAERTSGAYPQGDDGPRLAAMAPRRILVVDDNRDAADTLAMLLRFLGADVCTAHDGLAALEALKTYRPSVIVLDLGMPGMDGFEVARRVRQEPTGHEITLIALSGWSQEEDRRRSQEAGIDHHLVKPVDLDALQALLSNLPARPPDLNGDREEMRQRGEPRTTH